MSTTADVLADGADVTDHRAEFQEPAANVAEYYDLPFATLHHFPARAHGQLGFRSCRHRWIRSAMQAYEWLFGAIGEEGRGRPASGVGSDEGNPPRRLDGSPIRGSLEIQGYDEVCFPGLADEWAKADGQRPFVGALTMEIDDGCRRRNRVVGR